MQKRHQHDNTDSQKGNGILLTIKMAISFGLPWTRECN